MRPLIVALILVLLSSQSALATGFGRSRVVIRQPRRVVVRQQAVVVAPVVRQRAVIIQQPLLVPTYSAYGVQSFYGSSFGVQSYGVQSFSGGCSAFFR